MSPGGKRRHEPFDSARFERLVAERQLALGRGLTYSASVTSTNDVALTLCHAGAPHGHVVLADHQTHGRGRRSNVWLSPEPGANLLFSVLLRLSPPNAVPSNVTLAMGLGLRDAVQAHVEAEVRIKWANDVWVDDKKLAGILVEGHTQPNAPTAFVVGIGLNVNQREFPEPIAASATSLALLTGGTVDREALLADILRCIGDRAALWQRDGFAPMAPEWARYDALRGRRVTVDGVAGLALGVDPQGALLLEVEGEPTARRILSGSVEVLA